MTMEGLIKYIYETPLEETEFHDLQQKGDRALILLSKYGEDAQQSLADKFGNKIAFNAITPKTAMNIMNIINKHYPKEEKKLRSINVAAEEDFKNFKKILEYFVHILRANNKDNDEKFFGKEAKSGQGYKGQAIRKSYEEIRYYSNGKSMDVSITPGYQLFNKTNYINWTETGYNIRAIWNDQKNDVIALQLYVDVANKWIGEKISLSDLGLNDGSMPNESLKKFYKNYSDLLLKSSENSSIIEELVDKLEKSKNIILRGAPGTGKTYLARQVAASLIGIDDSQVDESDQYGFVQFHPSYDYTDFVEGLRPVTSEDEEKVSFKLVHGIFKAFCNFAANSDIIDGTDNFEDSWEMLVNKINENDGDYMMERSNVPATLNSRNSIKFKTPVATKDTVYKLYRGEETNLKYETYQSIVLDHLFKKYDLKPFKEGKRSSNQKKKFVFVIDEINRGEISKIFGELFFSIDPGYRGKEKYGVYTQYSNLHTDKKEKFFIPDNIYIIGTMNDIDRSVDSFDFAMRRRFRFIEIKAEDTTVMWQGQLEDSEIKEATNRLYSLNDQISVTDGLNTNYHIGPSYFLKLPELNYDYEVLWEDYLKPLLEDYLRGSYEEQDKLDKMKAAYDLKVKIDEVDTDEDRG
jgi:hypothetical protein